MLPTRQLVAAYGTLGLGAATPRILGSTGSKAHNQGTQYDAIFIGAGINVLGAAYLLSLAGWKVLVLDKNPQPGGAIHTGEFTLPGFKHDFGAMNLGQLLGSPFFQQHGDALKRKGVVFIIADNSYSSVFADGTFVGVSTNVEATLQLIATVSSLDAEAWRAWNADFDVASRTLFRLLQSPARWPFKHLDYAYDDGDATSTEAHHLTSRILADPLRQILTTRFHSEQVRGLIAAWGMHLDFAPDIPGGSLIPFLESNADQRFGIPLAQGGSGTVIRALADLIRDAGGEVRLKVMVRRILIEGGRARGVQSEGGEEIRCRRAVVASVTPPALLRLTGDALPPSVAAAAKSWQFGPGTMMIHLALSDVPPWRAGDEARRFFYVHVNSKLDQLTLSYQQARAGLLPVEPMLVVGQPTVFDPSRAPTGRHTLWVMVRAVPAKVRGDAAGLILDRRWAAIKDPYADRMIEQIERHAPGFKRCILARTVFSPEDLEAANPNLVGGDLLAGSHHLPQWYNRRPFVGYANYRMPIEGLYMVGAATWPGAGATPGSGNLLAQQLLGQL